MNDDVHSGVLALTNNDLSYMGWDVAKIDDDEARTRTTD